mmetsp:Transcript_12458/g.37398  ORF Transcript_12458/g.37398 Transcript_12458/m.37398 type:complete len:251 (-) Transcript_12458:47-799(-)
MNDAGTGIMMLLKMRKRRFRNVTLTHRNVNSRRDGPTDFAVSRTFKVSTLDAAPVNCMTFVMRPVAASTTFDTLAAPRSVFSSNVASAAVVQRFNHSPDSGESLVFHESAAPPASDGSAANASTSFITSAAASPTRSLTALKPSGKRLRGARLSPSSSPPLTPKSIGTVPSTAVALLNVSTACSRRALAGGALSAAARAHRTLATMLCRAISSSPRRRRGPRSRSARRKQLATRELGGRDKLLPQRSHGW